MLVLKNLFILNSLYAALQINGTVATIYSVGTVEKDKVRTGITVDKMFKKFVPSLHR